MLATPGLATLSIVTVTILGTTLVIILVVVVFILVTLLLAVMVIIVSAVLLIVAALLTIVVASAPLLAIAAIEGKRVAKRTVRHSRRRCHSDNVPAGHGRHRGIGRTADRRGSTSPGPEGGFDPDSGRSRRRSDLPADVRTSWGKIGIAM